MQKRTIPITQQNNFFKKYQLKINGTKWIGNKIGFDFNSRDQDSFIFSTWKMQVNKKVYIYQRNQNIKQKINVLISSAMDCTNQLQLMFALKIQQNQQQVVLKFQTIKDVIHQNQIAYQLFQSLGKDRTKKQTKKIEKLQQQNGKRLFLIGKQKIPQYFSPKIEKQHDIWFALRYMGQLLLEQGMKIRICFKPNSLGNGYHDLQITRLKLTYDIQQVSYEKIENDQSLSMQNQMNLLHIQQFQQVQTDINSECSTCLDTLLYNNVKLQRIAVNACDCSGGQKYKHLNCLIDWIKQKQQKKVLLMCQVCLRYYPQYLQLTRYFQNSIVKETKIIDLMDKNRGPSIFINRQELQPKQGQIIIGNKSINGFRIWDESVIDHAAIRLNQLQYTAYIKDLKTKYGVLIKTKNMEFKIKKQEISKRFVSILTGMHLFTFSFCDKK